MTIYQEGDVHILAIPGSLRRNSFNRALLDAAAHIVPTGVDLTIWGGLAEVPPFNEDSEQEQPPAVADLRRAVAQTDAVLIATPEYNGSIPGQLKNALDWISRPFAVNPLRGKPVALIGASPSPGGTAAAQADLRRVLARIGAAVFDRGLTVPRAFEVIGGGRGLAPEAGDRLRELLEELCTTVRMPVVS